MAAHLEKPSYIPLPDYLDNPDNYTLYAIEKPPTRWDDATWILSSTFIIFTMQSGFGLLESGSASQKNEVNIMVKNAVDVLFGGISYWMFGYGLSFGKDRSNPFVGTSDFFMDRSSSHPDLGDDYAHFFFHASFATTATTIVSGAMAERTKLETYIVFSFLNTIVYSVPVHWIWGQDGWLKAMGAVDIAGAGAVHMVGGVTGLVATLILKPRTGRFVEGNEAPQMGSATNAIFGLFMLWWGWLGFNCGSTYGITDQKWILTTRSAVATITASMGGGMSAIFLSYVTMRKKFLVSYVINGILGSLVAISALCALAQPWHGLVIGIVGAIIACLGCKATERLHIDDPVGVVPVHALAAIWGLLAVGIFGNEDDVSKNPLSTKRGLIAGGGWELLGVQALACVSIIAWTAVTSFICLILLDCTLGLRVPLHEELLGADIVEHSLNGSYDKSTGEWRDHHGNILAVIKKGNTAEHYLKVIREVHEGLRMADSPSAATPTKKSAFGFRRSDTGESDIRDFLRVRPSSRTARSHGGTNEAPRANAHGERMKVRRRLQSANGNRRRTRLQPGWEADTSESGRSYDDGRIGAKGSERFAARDLP